MQGDYSSKPVLGGRLGLKDDWAEPQGDWINDASDEYFWENPTFEELNEAAAEDEMVSNQCSEHTKLIATNDPPVELDIDPTAMTLIVSSNTVPCESADVMMESLIVKPPALPFETLPDESTDATIQWKSAVATTPYEIADATSSTESAKPIRPSENFSVKNINILDPSGALPDGVGTQDFQDDQMSDSSSNSWMVITDEEEGS